MLNVRYVILALLLVVSNAFAAGKFERVSGDVRVGASPVKVGDELADGGTVTTGANGLAVVRFDDGHVIALEKNTIFKVDNYAFDAKQPENGKVFFSMLQGALRSITGMIGAKNKSAFALKAPMATIGIRGSDWVAAIQGNSLYTGVSSGGIVVSNPAASLAVNAGQFSATAGASASQLVTLSQLPAGVFGSLPQMSLSGVAASSAGASSAGASAGTIGGVSAGSVAIGGAVAAAVAAAASNSGNTSNHGSHGSHGQ